MLSRKFRKLSFVAVLVFSASAQGSEGGSASSHTKAQPDPVIVASAAAAAGGGACLPLNKPISFSATGAYMDSANLVIGQVPDRNAPFGSASVITIDPAAAQSGYTLARQGVDAMIDLKVTPVAPRSEAQPAWLAELSNARQVNVTGTVTLTDAMLKELMTRDLSTLLNNFDGTLKPFEELCVTGIAIDAGFVSTYVGERFKDSQIPTKLIAPRIYLYLNNTNHGIVLHALNKSKKVPREQLAGAVDASGGFAVGKAL